MALEVREVDIKENSIKQLDAELLSLLLKDRSSGKNIIWATDNYAYRGEGFFSQQPMTIKAITGKFGKVIRPRIEKSKKEQQYRIRDKAEVFTPSWICNKQNNLVDNSWFGRKDIFNVENGETWTVNREKIIFPVGKNWQTYVKANRMEVSCGEAPYLVSRYDTVTGQWIDINNRIGILDRKLRVVGENTVSKEEWIKWVYEAYKSTYGFEWQGDNLLIARENMLFSFVDYYIERFGCNPEKEYLVEIAKILSWNLFQMDGLKFVVPNSCKPVRSNQVSLFDNDEKYVECEGCVKDNNNKHTGIYCKIMDWETNKPKKFINILKECR